MDTMYANQFQPEQKKSNVNSLSYILGKKDSSRYDEQTRDFSFYKPGRTSSIPKSLPAPSPLLQYGDYSTYTSAKQNVKCNQCGIGFPSDDALLKHQRRFCIGVKDSGIGYKSIDPVSEEINDEFTKRSTVGKVARHQLSIDKKRAEVDEWKRQRAVLQTVEDMKNRILVDQYKTQKIADHTKKQANIYHEILDQYERLRRHEQDVLRRLYTLKTQYSSLKYPDSTLKQTNDLTDRQLEELQRKTARLERERQIIQRKLEEYISINKKSSAMFSNEPYRFLSEMKEQQQLNEKALEFLRGAYVASNRSLSTGSGIPSLPYINPPALFSGQSNGDYVRNSRQNYLRSGGHDAGILATYSDLEYKLRAYEEYPWLSDNPEPLQQANYQQRPSIDPASQQLKLINNDNNRLQTEVNDMQRKFESLDTRTRQLELSMGTNEMPNSTDYNRYIPPQVEPYHLYPSYDYEDDIDQRPTNHYTSIPNLDQRITPRSSPAMKLLDSNMYKVHNSLAPRTYDPTGGFIIFFDFILNLPPATKQCCLITCLHHPKSGLGEPSLLEPIRCNAYMDERTGDRSTVALIATKQPVPRCPPQQALTVVIEIQISTDGQTSREYLRTDAWAKLPLFDHKNRLASGRWKVPLRALPINHNDSLAVVSRSRSYERAELYYRLVNLQDADEQSNVPLAPSFKDLYAYPLQYRD